MRRRRIAALGSLAIIGIYVSLYALNSMAGGYRLIWTSTFNHRIDYRKDISEKGNDGAMGWQPRFGTCTRLSSDTVGKIFYPLVFLDQAFWHRDILPVYESRKEFEAALPLSKVHPEDRKNYRPHNY